MVHWLLCDYGGVLSLPQDPTALARVAALVERPVDDLTAAYWRHRLPYDRGEVTAAQYWAAVVGATQRAEVVSRLVALDVASWTRPNRPVLAAARAARRAGISVAVLSNAPAEIARALDRLRWMAGFSPRLFSCDLRLAKPDAAIFATALTALGATPAEVVFVDDREENVTAARAVGLDARRFCGPEDLGALALS